MQLIEQNSNNKAILAIHFGHNATVGLFINGQMKSILSEERINRIKNSTGFPEKSFKYLIDNYLNGNTENIAQIIIFDDSLFGYQYFKKYGFDSKQYSEYYCYTRKHFIDNISNSFIKDTKRKLRPIKNSFQHFLGLSNSQKLKINYNKQKNIAIAEYSRVIGVKKEKISLYEHHKSHAFSPLLFNDLNSKYIIFTLDAEGDGLCASVNIWDNGHLETIAITDRKHSLGYLYSEVTGYLGMKVNEHEYKVMGMAPYADPKNGERICEIFRKILWLNDSDNFYSELSMMNISEYLIRNLIYERFDHICAGIQQFTEEIVCDWIQRWVRKTEIKNILLSGGVFMNVKLSKKVSELDNVNKLFVMPSSGDESLVIGGCLMSYLNMGYKDIIPISNLYLGREFDDNYIENLIYSSDLERYRIEKLSSDLMAKKVSELLFHNKIVARCVGKEEWGARALGNRSILCNPSNLINLNVLNQKIKNRDFWMPFTPSILYEDLQLYIENPKNIFSPYMCITFDSTTKAKKELQAAIHPKDFSVRPQGVIKEWNPGYYMILEEFKKLTGISGVLNTSFNLHGEPVVGSPEDAISTVDRSGLEYLILGSFLFEKINK